MNLFLLTAFAVVGAIDILKYAAIAYTGEAIPYFGYEHATFYIIFILLAIAVVCVVVILSVNVALKIEANRVAYGDEWEGDGGFY